MGVTTPPNYAVKRPKRAMSGKVLRAYPSIVTLKFLSRDCSGYHLRSSSMKVLTVSSIICITHSHKSNRISQTLIEANPSANLPQKSTVGSCRPNNLPAPSHSMRNRPSVDALPHIILQFVELFETRADTNAGISYYTRNATSQGTEGSEESSDKCGLHS